MIGSHDTYTFENPILGIWNASKRLWKTQCKTIDEQYNYGVRMFDVRVARTINGKWVACHGAVNFHKHWDKLEDICKMFSINYPEAIYRIVLEKGGKLVQKKFKKEAKNLCKKYPNLWRIDIKSTKYWLGGVDNNNQNLYDRGYKFALVNTWEPPCYEEHGTLTIKNLFSFNIKDEAKSKNQNGIFKNIPTGALRSVKDEIDLQTKDTLYFIDYCTNEYD